MHDSLFKKRKNSVKQTLHFLHHPKTVNIKTPVYLKRVCTIIKGINILKRVCTIIKGIMSQPPSVIGLKHYFEKIFEIPLEIIIIKLRLWPSCASLPQVYLKNNLNFWYKISATDLFAFGISNAGSLKNNNREFVTGIWTVSSGL